jgi:hypothetical protein
MPQDFYSMLTSSPIVAEGCGACREPQTRAAAAANGARSFKQQRELMNNAIRAHSEVPTFPHGNSHFETFSWISPHKVVFPEK